MCVVSEKIYFEYARFVMYWHLWMFIDHTCKPLDKICLHDIYYETEYTIVSFHWSFNMGVWQIQKINNKHKEVKSKSWIEIGNI